MKSIEIKLSEAVDAMSATAKEKFYAWQKEHKGNPVEIQLNAAEVFLKETDQKVRRNNGVNFGSPFEDDQRTTTETNPAEAQVKSYQAMGFSEAESRRILDLPARAVSEKLNASQAAQFQAYTRCGISEAQALLMVSTEFDEALKGAIKKGKNAREFVTEFMESGR